MLRTLLIDGPAEGQIVETDGRTIYWPIRPPLSPTALVEADPGMSPSFEKAEYSVDPLPSIQWDGPGREYNAIGIYIKPPLKCGHSRERDPLSVYVLNIEEAKATMDLPEYRNHFPDCCPTCGLVLQLKSVIPMGGWAEWKRATVGGWMDYIAARRERESWGEDE